jgi:hypothetical protein
MSTQCVRIAQPSDWKAEPLPAKRSTLVLNRLFSAEEVDCMRRGLVPSEMEDKWFIYWKDGALHFHRSWTGFCICVASFQQDESGWRMVEAAVNRDPEQYGESNDARDAEQLSFLIDVLLLHGSTAFRPACG